MFLMERKCELRRKGSSGVFVLIPFFLQGALGASDSFLRANLHTYKPIMLLKIIKTRKALQLLEFDVVYTVTVTGHLLEGLRSTGRRRQAKKQKLQR